jgi:hypothetical protein
MIKELLNRHPDASCVKNLHKEVLYPTVEKYPRFHVVEKKSTHEHDDRFRIVVTGAGYGNNTAIEFDYYVTDSLKAPDGQPIEELSNITADYVDMGAKFLEILLRNGPCARVLMNEAFLRTCRAAIQIAAIQKLSMPYRLAINPKRTICSEEAHLDVFPSLTYEVPPIRLTDKNEEELKSMFGSDNISEVYGARAAFTAASDEIKFTFLSGKYFCDSDGCFLLASDYTEGNAVTGLLLSQCVAFEFGFRDLFIRRQRSSHYLLNYFRAERT